MPRGQAMNDQSMFSLVVKKNDKYPFKYATMAMTAFLTKPLEGARPVKGFRKSSRGNELKFDSVFCCCCCCCCLFVVVFVT